MQAAQSSVGKVLSNLRHVAADGRLALDQVDLLAGVGQRQRGVDAGDAAADHQHVGWIGTLLRLQRLVAGHAPHRGAHQVLRLLGGACALSVCTQESCSRMLTMWKKNGFSPPLSVAVRNVCSCRCGEQEATTMRFSLWSRMSCRISSWPGSEHMYL